MPQKFAQSANGAGGGGKLQYYVVVDAGSTGSRAFIYKKSQDGTVSLAAHPDMPKSPAILEVVPGLSSYAESPEKAYDDTFHRLLKFAAAVIPSSKVSSTPLFVRGTAGLRRISAAHRQEIFHNLFARTRRDYDFQLSDGRDPGTAVASFGILAGEMEGIYAWLAINNKEGTLGAGASETYGAVDIGGSSSQIVFAVNEQMPSKALRQKDSPPAGVDDMKRVMGFDLYSHSFPRTGMSAMWDVYLHDLARGTDDVGAPLQELSSPCLHQGQTVEYECGFREGDYTCFMPLAPGAPPLDLSKTPNKRRVTLRGTGNFHACKAALEHQIVSAFTTEGVPCAACVVDGTRIPAFARKPMRFLGLSEYWYTSNFYHHNFGMQTGQPYDAASFESYSERWCSQPWPTVKAALAELQRQDPTVSAIEIDQFHIQCRKSAWLAAYISAGLRLDNSDAARPASILPIEDTTSWTIGFLLATLGEEDPSHAGTGSRGGSMGLKLLGVAVLAVILFVVAAKVVRRSQRYNRRLTGWMSPRQKV